MSTRETQSHPSGEFCQPLCPACADQEAEAREAAPQYDYYWERALRMERVRRRAERSEWHRLFGDLETLRRALTGALPLRADEQYWPSREGAEGDEPYPQAEWAVRFGLLDAAPSDRAAMESLARALYRSQIAVLARYADLDQLTPDLRARVAAAVASPEMTAS